ncbi:MAG: T9SS type A sorting domain-containing protein [Saprospiraceae bacterium]|nr:T9SS type A sorting domain-containing protein [Saprospiraceae bacterium]MCF8250435.1 T9SS type A sorting domain-containing protein [Saprospiraceae bacterium]MCF8280645.1 T9SS type A sorting domain-containing protein [Bacteroidales bacterium]MCF8312190.1 T9SS type A sorting domain-containing protein [Saprospiraceae bacterium]MCF8440531.1 T9SS type A sorting domain-containing protein [Saprospiraceae bacterium]
MQELSDLMPAWTAYLRQRVYLLDISIFDIDISLFPNPTTSELTLKLLPAIPGEKLQVKIYNVLGQLIKVEESNFTSTDYHINVRDFAVGMYLLEVEAFGKRWVRKFVKR